MIISIIVIIPITANTLRFAVRARNIQLILEIYKQKELGQFS